MAIYIYRSGGGSPNPGPQNPLVRFLISAAVLICVIGVGILLLPVFGVIALVILGLIAFLIVGGLIYRWIYVDPIANAFKKAQAQAEAMRVNPEFKPSAESQPQKAQTWKRTQNADIEDAVVVEEKPRQPQ